MQPLPLTILVAACLSVGDNSAEEPTPIDLSVRYEPGLQLGMHAEFEYTDEVMAKVSIEEQREVEMPAGVGLTQRLRRTLEVVDDYREVAHGQPRTVARHFEVLDADLVRASSPGEVVEVDSGLLEGVTLELRRDESGVEARYAEQDEATAGLEELELEGFVMHLGFDALLPAGAVRYGATWQLDAVALEQALQLNTGALLFPPALKADAALNARKVGRGIGLTLKSAQWELEASLSEETQVVEGVECFVIELDGRGVFDQPRLGAERRTRASRWRHIELELEGQAFLAVESHLPMRVEVAIDVAGQEALATRGRSGAASVRTTYSGHVSFAAAYEPLEAAE